jgi:curved DNA binding protein
VNSSDLYGPTLQYKFAGEITAKAIKATIAACQEGKTVLDICKVGDKAVEEGVAGVFKNDKKLQKGSAFPTTVSINNIICNYAPLPSDSASSTALKTGDMVKIQLGAHIDGYATVAAETMVVGASKSKPVEGPAADALKAAWTAAECAIRVMMPGKTNHEVAKEVEACIKEFKGVRPVEGMQTNQMDKDVIDGKKKIVLAAEASSKPDACKLEENEVYGVDIQVTTSESGKPKTDTDKTTIYKKTGSTYQLKMATSRKIFSEVQKVAGAFPFNLSVLEDEKKARMGIQECVNHNLVTPFEVLYDGKDGAVTAQIFFTAAINSKGAVSDIYRESDACIEG